MVHLVFGSSTALYGRARFLFHSAALAGWRGFRCSSSTFPNLPGNFLSVSFRDFSWDRQVFLRRAALGVGSVRFGVYRADRLLWLPVCQLASQLSSVPLRP